MTISVVMTTFNGKKYLLDQLDSIKRQTRQPDEVIIFDDRSLDGTSEIINNYIINNLLDWKLVINNENYGYKYNFIQGIEKATGQIIFLSDQDDVWHIDKIEKMATILEKNPKIKLLASNFDARYYSIDAQKILIKQSNNNKIEKVKFDEKIIYVNRPGCTYCFKSDFYQSAKKYWQPSLAHDQLLWYFAASNDQLYIYNNSMIEFRRHNNNSSGNYYKQRKQNLAYINEQKKNIEILFLMVKDSQMDRQKIMILRRAKRFIETRLCLYSSRNIKYYLKLIIFYQKFYYTLRSMIGDFILGMISSNNKMYK